MERSKMSQIEEIEQKKRILRENGYHTLWHEENWVHKDDPNPDWSGRPLEQAYNQLMKSQMYD